MSLDLIRERLLSYQLETTHEKEQALKEITQEIILMSLSRQDFFSHAEFHGGTALRILYGLQRFSEDLDFALLTPNSHFSLRPYLETLARELKAFGYDFEIKDRSAADNIVKKAFLKDDSIGKVLELTQGPSSKKIKIKLEVDSNPPAGAKTEIKYLDFPLPFGVTAKDLPSSFAGKLHALLCRSYVKGRDWYDFIWYVSRKTPVNLVLLENALKQNGPWKDKAMKLTPKRLLDELDNKINHIDWQQAVRDIAPFIGAREQVSLKVWSPDFFHAEVERMRVSYMTSD